MSSLHTINKSGSHSALDSCLKVVQDQDSVLLIEDGVYLLNRIAGLPLTAGITVYALREDLQARGFSESELPSGIAAIGYDEFVALVCKHQRSLNCT